MQNDWYCAYGSTYTDTGVAMTPGVYQRLTIVSNGTTASWFINGQPTSTGCTAVAVSGFPAFQHSDGSLGIHSGYANGFHLLHPVRGLHDLSEERRPVMAVGAPLRGCASRFGPRGQTRGKEKSKDERKRREVDSVGT